MDWERIAVVGSVVVGVVVAIIQKWRTPVEIRKTEIEIDALEDGNFREWVRLQLSIADQTIARLSANVDQADRTIKRLTSRLTAVEAELDAEERHAAERERKIQQQEDQLRTQEMEIADLRTKVESQASKLHDQANEITRMRAALEKAGFPADIDPDDIDGQPV